MEKITSNELRKAFCDFYISKGHALIGSASLIPENDPTVLFTTAGMHPLVPYLQGEPHPLGKRLCSVQKCVRTGDIDEVGDKSHCTFFEMLGNWSLGDYGKEEAINYSYEFLTSVLKINPDNLAFTVFAGDENAPRDEEAIECWKSHGIKDEQIFALPKENNWWGPAGLTGPCGTDTEMFIDNGAEKCSDECSPACDCGKYLEIWNEVFMQYDKREDGKFLPLKQKNVDGGMGLERTLCILNGYKSVYDTDLFSGVIKLIESLSGKKYGEDEATDKAIRIIADHVRTVTFIMGDQKGVVPSNVDQGYVVRRLIRRAVRYASTLEMDSDNLVEISKAYIEQYKDIYPELLQNAEKVTTELKKEIDKFQKTLQQGLGELEKVLKFVKDGKLNGKTAFRLYDTFGFPIEMTVELAKEKGFTVDMEGYKQAEEKHKQASKAGAEQKFAGGLADNQEATTNLHTAAHLMLAGLRKLFGENTNQRGSNITAERLRFDFNLDRKMEADEIKKVEDYVNEAIQNKVPVVMEEMPIEKAREIGATGIFDNKYGDVVKVYTIGEYSKEICGGPHAKNTGDLGTFKIVKEQSSSSGVRRIKAILTK
ncbi:MAG: alanine--tRNA ligase [Clostridia bacterium]|nr:alanine--tRNA ligase [Clostridia bacterium]MDY5264328.1 alanine--tRNA ligase [Eubacteriales bacterium]